MDRKKTILVAVLINAGLLAVLFIASLATQDEASLAPREVSNSSGAAVTALERPLFQDPAEIAFAPAVPVVEPLPIPQLQPQPSQELASAPAIHNLPPLISETTPKAPASAPLSQPASQLEVVVKKGDTLDKIAKANRTTADEIIKTNHLASSFLRAGQVLKIPAEPAENKAAAKTLPKPLPEKTAQASGPEYYTVKVGDNPWTIAMKNHMKVDELLKLNQLNDEKARKLKPGDRLRIR